jgi:UDP-4-amino-4-deoxy-L-arabinose-oxoglutarate aminotransferase
MVVSRHKLIVDRVWLLSQHAMTSNAYQRRRAGGGLYDVVSLGHKANMTDVQAAIGLGQLASFERNQRRRAALAERYCANLADLREFLETPCPAEKSRHAWHLFIIRLHLSPLKVTRNGFIARMADAGIECGVHYRPLFEMSFYKSLGLDGRYLPNAAYAGERVVTLPLYPHLKPAEVDYICDRIHRIVTRERRLRPRDTGSKQKGKRP